MSAPTDPITALVDELDGGDSGTGGVLALLRALADTLGRAEMPKTATALDATVERLGAATRRAREHLELGDTAVLSIGDLPGPES